MSCSRGFQHVLIVVVLLVTAVQPCPGQSLWNLAKDNKELLTVSTLFTAQNVRAYLSSDKGIDDAIDWCKKTGVTHVFVESFRDNYTAEREALEHAKDRFSEEGFEVSGCVTTTRVGKISTGWNVISCYTDNGTQKQLQEIFEYTASIFDEIMIDDFLFTDCRCEQCKQARGDQSWADYRCDLMVKVSRERILGPARAVNPNVKIIIKYPQWYDNFHNRGYEVLRETADYDKIWVGTETRNYDDPRWGGKVQYEAYYIMRWLGEIGGAKTGGGWFDPYGTTEDTYVEQARQTVLADAKEMLLFCYGSLLRQTGPANVEKLRTEIPGLFKLAKLVRGKPIRGVAAPKPPNSDAHDEQYVYGFVGMLGLPLVPTARISPDAKAAFFSVQAMKEPRLREILGDMVERGKPVLITDGLAKRLSGFDTERPNVVVLDIKGKPNRLLELSREQLKSIRDNLLAPFGMKFDAPNKVGLYMIGNDCVVIENFNDESIDVVLEFARPINARKSLVLPIDGNADFKLDGNKLVFSQITPRTLVALEYRQVGRMERRVMAFYYPWYGTADGPGGAGRTVHWGKIDAEAKDIAASTHYPTIGAYDSHDPQLIEKHCTLAKQAKIDTFIVSWWGHGSFSDRAMNEILNGCARHGLKACIYYETVPRPQTEQSAARNIVKVLAKYAGHSAHLRIDGKPVVFVYGRALQELGLLRWLKAIEIVNADFKDGVTAIGDQFGYGAARVFDGLHTYNTAGPLGGLKPQQVRSWATETYRSWVKLADGADKISTITVIPGYDDTKIRTPGLAVERYAGASYRIQWEAAIAADPHWVLITSFNEWHEGSEIEPSLEYGRKYIDLTAEYAGRFKASKRARPKTGALEGQISNREKIALAAKLKSLRIAVLPGADSMAFWWLLDAGVKAEPVNWQQVTGDDLCSKEYDVVLYCAGEHYQSTVDRQGDVDEALVKYLRSGGTLAFLPSLPWPCYYDKSGRAVNHSAKFGLTLRSAWERPPDNAELSFVQPSKRLLRVPERFDFPTSGDLRWRPFFVGDHTEHVPLLQLHDSRGEYLGDAVSYAEVPGGGKILYVWFSLLAGPHAEGLLYDVFDFLAERRQSRSIR